MEKLLKEIAAIPDAPFLYHPVKQWIKKTLTSLKIQGLIVDEDEFALYAKITKGYPARKIYLVSHLDHPGIIFKNKDYGLPFGSVGYDKLGNYDYTRLPRQQAKSPISLKIYKPDGQFQQPATINNVSLNSNVPIVSIIADQPVLPNSIGIWDTLTFKKSRGRIYMRNADNNAATALILQLLRECQKLTNLHVEVIFTYLEEVVQISSMAIAKRGATPFGKISANDFIINLDPMEIETSTVEESLIKKFHLKKPHYEDGLIIKSNDRNLIYGLFFNETNLAETLLNTGLSKLKIAHQLTITCNSTDAKSFSLFPLTPHIATIAIPCLYKHNQGPKGQFVAEEVLQRDLDNTVKLLKWAITQKLLSSSNSLSDELKKIHYGLSTDKALRLRREELKAVMAAKPRLGRGIYFGRNFIEILDITFWRLLSKFL